MHHIVQISGKIITDFIEKQDTGRIRQVSYDFYKNAPVSDYIALGLYENEELIGVTACSWKSEFGITLVRKDYLKKGFGKILLQEKIKHFKNKHIQYRTVVADDNIPSKKMCIAVGLREIKRDILKRRGGREEYTAIVFANEAF